MLNRLKPTKLFSFLLVLTVSGFLLAGTTGCGGSACDGTIFVNESTTEDVVVSANALSGVQFDTFTLGPDEQQKVCGDDNEDILGDYEWEDGDTANLGQTCSSCDICIFLEADHTATSGDAGTC